MILCEQYGLDTSFLELCSEYQINVDYALAVFVLETGHTSSSLWLESNNPAGIKQNSNRTNCTNTKKGYCVSESKQEGMEQMITLMARYANQYHLRTVEEQRSLWSETEDVEKVVNLMNQIRVQGR